MLVPLMWLALSVRDRAAWRRLWLPTLVAVLLVSPYLVHLRAATGGWTLMGKTRWVYAMGVAQARAPEDPIPLEALEATLAEVGRRGSISSPGPPRRSAATSSGRGSWLRSCFERLAGRSRH